jgi:hypothetical protein
MPAGGRLVERGEDPALGRLVIAGRGTGTGRVDEPDEAVTGETRPPLAHPGRAGQKLPGDLVGADAVCSGEDDPRPLNHPLLACSGPQPGPERRLLSLRQHDRGGGLPHSWSVYHAAL